MERGVREVVQNIGDRFRKVRVRVSADGESSLVLVHGGVARWRSDRKVAEILEGRSSVFRGREMKGWLREDF